MHKPLVIALLIGLLLGVVLTSAYGQLRALDPASVAPHIFQVAMENDRVRVLKITERHGETQPLHSLRDRVVVFLSNCAWLSEDPETGSTRMDGYKFGDVVWREAVTGGGHTSSVIDACLSVAVELKN